MALKYVKSCGGVSEDTSRVATSGINTVVAEGAPAYFFWTPTGVELDSMEAPQDIDSFNDLVKESKGVFLGKHTVESTGSDREVYEDTFFGLKVTTTSATKTLQLTAPMCACTSAELEKMQGRSGLIWEITTLGFLKGRVNSNGKPQGFPVANMYKAINSIATTDTPVSNTILELPYSDPRGDQKAPYSVPVDWDFSEVDQPMSVEAVVSGYSTDGSNLLFDLDLTKDCSDAVLTGGVKASFSITDANGAEITDFTVSEVDGKYSFNVVTGESTVNVETDGIVEIESSLYTMDEIKISA